MSNHIGSKASSDQRRQSFGQDNDSSQGSDTQGRGRRRTRSDVGPTTSSAPRKARSRSAEPALERSSVDTDIVAKKERTPAEHSAAKSLDSLEQGGFGQLLENQRQLTQVPFSGATLDQGHVTLSASNLQLHDAAGNGALLARDRLLFSGDPTTSTQMSGGLLAGVVGVSAGGAISDTTALTGFTGHLGPVAAAAVTVKVQLGAAALATTPLVVASAGTSLQVEQVDAENRETKLVFTTRGEASISGTVMASMGLGGVAARLGVNVGREVSFAGTYSLEQASEMRQLARSNYKSILVGAGIKKLPEALGNSHDPIKVVEEGLLPVGNSISLSLQGSAVAGVAGVLGGVMVGGHFVAKGNFNLTITATDEGYRSTVGVEKLKEWNVTVDVPLAQVGSVSFAKGFLRQSTFDHDKDSPEAMQALKNLMSKDQLGLIRLPRPLFPIDPSAIDRPIEALEMMQGMKLPEGLVHVSDTLGEMAHKISLRSAVTAPLYILADRFGTIGAEASAQKVRSLELTDQKAKVTELHQHDRDRQLLKFFRKQSQASLLQVSSTGFEQTVAANVWRIAASLRYVSQVRNVHVAASNWLKDTFSFPVAVPTDDAKADSSRKEGVLVSVSRPMTLSDWTTLIKSEAVPQDPKGWRQELLAAEGQFAETLDVAQRYAAMAGRRIEKFGASEVGRLHRLLDAKGTSVDLDVEYQDLDLQKSIEKAIDKQVKHAMPLDNFATKKIPRIAAKRIGDVRAVIHEVDARLSAFRASPIVKQVMSKMQLTSEEQKIEDLKASLAEVVASGEQTERVRNALDANLDAKSKKDLDGLSSLIRSRRGSQAPDSSPSMSRRTTPAPSLASSRRPTSTTLPAQGRILPGDPRRPENPSSGGTAETVDRNPGRRS